MDRADLDAARLAAALLFSSGGPHSAGTRRLAYEKARELYRALEDAPVTEETLARAIHGAWCSGTHAEQFHAWSYHRPTAAELLLALDDVELEAKLARRASDGDLPAGDSRRA